MANAAAAAPASPGIIRADLGGTYEVTAGDSTDSYASLRDALDAALPTVATREKTATLRNPDTGELNGAWRWLPATDVEPSAVGGVRIDAAAIREMAASLNARPGPVPIDGGPTPAGMLPSDVHGTAYTGGGTPANGWAHWAVVVEGPGADQAKLYLYAELVPEVARELDAGRIATGSVHFGYASLEGEAPRGVELISHALTNDPAVKTLAPANSVRERHVRRAHHLIGVLRARPITRKTTMSKPTTIQIRAGLSSILDETAKKSGKAPATVRGPALDKLGQVASLLGISIDDEMSSDSWESPTSRAICVLKDAAMEEKILDAAIGTQAPAAAASAPAGGAAAASAQRTDAAPAPAPAPAPAADPAAQRAPVAGLADEPAKDTFITQLMAALVQAGLAKDGDTADAALAALQANAAKISGALGAADAPADPAAQQQMSAERARESAELVGLRGRVLELEKRVKAADEAEALRVDEAWFDAEIARRSKPGLPFAITDGERKTVFAARAALGSAAWREHSATVFFNARHQPPTATVMPATDDERGSGKTPASVTEAIDSFVAEAKKQAKSPDEPAAHTRSRATRMARAAFPQLFGLAPVED